MQQLPCRVPPRRTDIFRQFPESLPADTPPTAMVFRSRWLMTATDVNTSIGWLSLCGHD